MNRKKQLVGVIRWVAVDLVSSILSVYLGLWLRFGFVREIPAFYFNNQLFFAAITFLIFVILNLVLSVYEKNVRLTPVPLFISLGASSFGVFFLQLIFDRLSGNGAPFEALMIISLLLFVYAAAGRILIEKLESYYHRKTDSSPMLQAAIYGAGELGCHLVGRLMTDATGESFRHLKPILFLDDAPQKSHTKIMGLPVYSSNAIQEVSRQHQIDVVIIAINKPQIPKIKDFLGTCSRLGIDVKRFGMFDNVQDISAEKIRNIQVEQLLGRKDISLDLSKAQSMLSGATVLVTGGSGSIGSEICRQVLALGCKKLIVFDINENGLFYLDQNLRQKFPNASYQLCVGSVRDYDRLDSIMSEFQPDVVFHAAAHKHVPMMELNPREAIKNNFLGTYNTAKAAAAHLVERFILISTDKAVNPTNIMGASKRMAELVIKMMNQHSATVFSAVRFGNVLGSIGSVVPIFQQQIAKGSAVTITHPDMRRYFMTIPEAVALVLDAGAMARGGEIFVLDMGEPVKIYDLACEMIRLSGLEPGRDIEIKYTGIRPGEKLYEEIQTDDENTIKTENNKIYINRSNEFDPDKTLSILEIFTESLERMDLDQIRSYIHQLVPTYVKKDLA